MSITVFIDGGHGTTGLEIRDRLAERDGITLIELGEEHRKDPDARLNALQSADFAVLCLPDDAVKSTVALLGDADTRIIDGSSVHRTAPGWAYGFPEMDADQADAMRTAQFVSVPGCYPTGFLALIRPLVGEGLLAAATPVSIHASSGYSGGGKSMIAEFENGEAKTAYRAYGLTMSHKHVPEMHKYSHLSTPPVFAPNVAAAYRGMIVEVGLHISNFVEGTTPGEIRNTLESAYQDSALISLVAGDPSLLTIERLANTDRLEIGVFSDKVGQHIRLIAMLDNLGKGAAGAAVQNLNLMAGFDELEGLRL